MNEEAGERESDDTPVRPEHVIKFLGWYGARVRLPRYQGMQEHWCNALCGRGDGRHLVLAELRNGIRRFGALSKQRYIEPVDFWHLCKSMRAPEVNNRFRAMREILKSGDKSC